MLNFFVFGFVNKCAGIVVVLEFIWLSPKKSSVGLFVYNIVRSLFRRQCQLIAERSHKQEFCEFFNRL